MRAKGVAVVLCFFTGLSVVKAGSCTFRSHGTQPYEYQVPIQRKGGSCGLHLVAVGAALSVKMVDTGPVATWNAEPGRSFAEAVRPNDEIFRVNDASGSSDGVLQALRNEDPVHLHIWRPRGSKNAMVRKVTSDGELGKNVSNSGQLLQVRCDARERYEIIVDGAVPRVVTIARPGEVHHEVRSGVVHVWGDALESDGAGDDEGRSWHEHAEAMRARCERNFVGTPLDAGHFCGKKHDNRLYVEDRYEQSDDVWRQEMMSRHEGRKVLNRQQPVNLHKFTDVGFQVGDIPQNLWAKLKDFHAKYRLSSNPENHGSADPNLSGRESETWLSNLPHVLKEEMRGFIKPVISAWSGISEDDLLPTSLFGLRLYHNGSVLHSHVDRKDTHVLSAIFEVDALPRVGQHLTSWPLSIVDHAGKTHEIPSRPGQYILYESATCAHGRVSLLDGREMANAFAHFKPRGWPEKYESRDRKEL